jgi:hypothetical protein
MDDCQCGLLLALLVVKSVTPPHPTPQRQTAVPTGIPCGLLLVLLPKGNFWQQYQEPTASEDMLEDLSDTVGDTDSRTATHLGAEPGYLACPRYIQALVRVRMRPRRPAWASVLLLLPWLLCKTVALGTAVLTAAVAALLLPQP